MANRPRPQPATTHDQWKWVYRTKVQCVVCDAEITGPIGHHIINLHVANAQRRGVYQFDVCEKCKDTEQGKIAGKVVIKKVEGRFVRERTGP